MTYSSETVRFLFHKLPTQTQVRYTDMEASLAKRGQRLHIDGVMQHDNILEVVVRITENFNLTPGGSSLSEH